MCHIPRSKPFTLPVLGDDEGEFARAAVGCGDVVHDGKLDLARAGPGDGDEGDVRVMIHLREMRHHLRDQLAQRVHERKIALFATIVPASQMWRGHRVSHREERSNYLFSNGIDRWHATLSKNRYPGPAVSRTKGRGMIPAGDGVGLTGVAHGNVEKSAG
jgi:hypothetical protein